MRFRLKRDPYMYLPRSQRAAARWLAEALRRCTKQSWAEISRGCLAEFGELRRGYRRTCPAPLT
jgi:hypothetical protein